jgi:LmbE family N-acetylglucosaminyl deacetylase
VTRKVSPLVSKAILLALLGLVAAVSTGATDTRPAPIQIGTGERLVVVAPHPDDEILGAAGLMQRVLERGGSVLVVLVTAGDGYVRAVARETGRPQPSPLQFVAYGKRRLHETQAALRQIGRDRLHLQFLGFPDGGLDHLLHIHWDRRHPERSPTTRVSDPPYNDALEPDVPYAGADLRRELVRLLRETNPTIVAFPDPLDKHPDHGATGLFSLLALDHWASTTRPPQTGKPPQLLAYLVHWPAWPPGWDAQLPRAASNTPLTLPADLPTRQLAPVALLLTDQEVVTKQAALSRYASQQGEMAAFLSAFIRQTEVFTVFPLHQLHNMMERPGRTAELPQAH